jgi:hypothetical protein
VAQLIYLDGSIDSTWEVLSALERFLLGMERAGGSKSSKKPSFGTIGFLSYHF